MGLLASAYRPIFFVLVVSSTGRSLLSVWAGVEASSSALLSGLVRQSARLVKLPVSLQL